MKDIRIGNDIIVSWSIFAEGAPYSLEGKEVTLYLCSQFGKRRAEGYAITGNQITWTFFGKEQKHIGKYSLELVVNEDAEGMVTTDACDFVNLVSCSCKVGGADEQGVQTESIELTSSFEFVPYDDTELRKMIEGKQDTLESGKTIKTINGQSILGEGNLEIEGGGESYDDTEIRAELDELSARVDNLKEEGKPIFKAVFGETTIEEIVEAYNSGKIVHCDYDNFCYVLSRFSAGEAYFSSVKDNYSYRLYCSSRSQWSKAQFPLELLTNKVTSLSDKSTDTQYPSAKAVYDAIEAVKEKEKEKDYELLLNTTIEEDVETFSIIDRVPNILDYKEYFIVLEFIYKEGATRTGWLSFYDAAQGINAVRLEGLVTANYLTHWILRIRKGRGFDRTAFLESHTNSFNSPQYDNRHKGLNLFAYPIVTDLSIYEDTMMFNFPLYAGDKINIYGR